MAKGVRLEMDAGKVTQRLKAKLDAVLPVVANQIRADCNRYVRVDVGTLRSSSYTASDLKRGKIIWNTPYAKRVYYTGHPSKDINAEASLRWCEVAKENHLQDWLRAAQKAVDE